MADLISLKLSAVDVQARGLTHVADALQHASSAGASLSIGANDFGLMCSFLSPFVQDATDEALKAIGSAAAAQLRAVKELRGVMDDFEDFEDEAIRQCKRVMDQLDEV